MSRLSAAILAAMLAAATGGCGKSACQELGERICRCQPGLSTAACQTEVEQQLKTSNPGQGYCDDKLDTCKAPEGQDLCEYLLTANGKRACGLAEPLPPP